MGKKNKLGACLPIRGSENGSFRISFVIYDLLDIFKEIMTIGPCMAWGIVCRNNFFFFKVSGENMKISACMTFRGCG